MKQLQLLMGMPITVEVVDPSVTEADIERVFAYFRAVDDSFSTYKEHSEISKVNRGELRSEEHTSELQSHLNLVCRLLLEKKKKKNSILSKIKHQLIIYGKMLCMTID